MCWKFTQRWRSTVNRNIISTWIHQIWHIVWIELDLRLWPSKPKQTAQPVRCPWRACLDTSHDHSFVDSPQEARKLFQPHPCASDLSHHSAPSQCNPRFESKAASISSGMLTGRNTTHGYRGSPRSSPNAVPVTVQSMIASLILGTCSHVPIGVHHSTDSHQQLTVRPSSSRTLCAAPRRHADFSDNSTYCFLALTLP